MARDADESPATVERLRDLDRLEAANRELTALVDRLFRVHEEQRRDIARALHDGAGQSITAIRMAAHAALAEDDPARRGEDLADVLAQAAAALDQVRGLCARLHPPPLDALGLEAALRWQVAALPPGDPARVELELAPLPVRPAADVEQACYRIAEEALSNALRHSGSSAVTLGLRAGGNMLLLDVVDDGSGFEPTQERSSGLVSMRERARAAGGRLVVATEPGRGTRIHAALPLR